MDLDYLKQKRILLVDDEQELLSLVVSILNEDGFQNIKTAKTVSEAVTVSETYQPERSEERRVGKRVYREV